MSKVLPSFTGAQVVLLSDPSFCLCYLLSTQCSVREAHSRQECACPVQQRRELSFVRWWDNGFFQVRLKALILLSIHATAAIFI